MDARVVTGRIFAMPSFDRILYGVLPATSVPVFSALITAYRVSTGGLDGLRNGN